MTYKIIHRAEQEILRLPEIKNFLRISHDFDDLWINELIRCAIEAAERFMRFRLIPVKVELRSEYVNNGLIKLPIGSVAEVISITAKTNSNAGLDPASRQAPEIPGQARDDQIRNQDYQLISPGKYEVKDFCIKLHDFPKNKSIKVEYIAGFIDQSTIPSVVKQGIMLHVAEMYDSHGSKTPISDEVLALYQSYRLMRI